MLTKNEQHEKINEISQHVVSKVIEFSETTGLSIRETAQVLGVNGQSLYSARSGNNPLSFANIVILADSTGLSVIQLLDNDTKINPESDKVRAAMREFESTAQDREREKLERQQKRIQERLANFGKDKAEDKATDKAEKSGESDKPKESKDNGKPVNVAKPASAPAPASAKAAAKG